VRRRRSSLGAALFVVCAAMCGTACMAVVGDGDYAVGGCSVNLSAVSAACESCFTARCGDSCGACTADSACLGAWNCALGCGGSSSCISACTSGLSSGSSGSLSAMASCEQSSCASECNATPPTGMGLGDSCTSASQCGSGDCNNGGWCTQSCSASNNVCAGGHGTDGLQNQFGQVNWCVLNSSNVDICFPGCSTTADCTHYPGTTCQSVTTADGSRQSICAG
jgi:hypothetical protein